MSRPHAPSRQSSSSSLLGSPITLSTSSSSSSISSSFGQRLVGKLRRSSKYNHKQLRCDEWDWTCQGESQPELSEASTSSSSPEFNYDTDMSSTPSLILDSPFSFTSGYSTPPSRHSSGALNSPFDSYFSYEPSQKSPCRPLVAPKRPCLSPPLPLRMPKHNPSSSSSSSACEQIITIKDVPVRPCPSTSFSYRRPSYSAIPSSSSSSLPVRRSKSLQSNPRHPHPYKRQRRNSAPPSCSPELRASPQEPKTQGTTLMERLASAEEAERRRRVRDEELAIEAIGHLFKGAKLSSSRL